jgi:hypothetical protein
MVIFLDGHGVPGVRRVAACRATAITMTGRTAITAMGRTATAPGSATGGRSHKSWI